ITGAQRIKLSGIAGTGGTRDEIGLIVRLNATEWPRIELGADDTLASCNLGRSEKARTAVGHRQQRFTVDRALEAKSEKMRLALAEKVIDVYVVANDRTRTGEAAVESDNCIEQPIVGKPARAQIDAEITGQE